MRRVRVEPRVEVGPGATGNAHKRILIAAAMSMPSSVLAILAPGADRDVQEAIRVALACYIKRSGGEELVSVGDAWNAWTKGASFVSLFPVRCGECKGSGLVVRPALSGSAVCRSCLGQGHVRVRQHVVASR